MGSAIVRASGPASRTTPIPPRPGGVAIATIVSSRFIEEFGNWVILKLSNLKYPAEIFSAGFSITKLPNYPITKS
jgi:hypothetical protein